MLYFTYEIFNNRIHQEMTFKALAFFSAVVASVAGQHYAKVFCDRENKLFDFDRANILLYLCCSYAYNM